MSRRFASRRAYVRFHPAHPERPSKSRLRKASSCRALALAGVLSLAAAPAAPQTDPGIRGGVLNTAGWLQYRGIPIPRPPVISPHPTTGAAITDNELAMFNEGILRAGQLEST